MQRPRFSLDTSTKKYICPGCGRRRFVVYRDEGGTGRIIDPTVGRCDREQQCGYHLTPHEFFASHPELRPARTTLPAMPPQAPPPAANLLLPPVAHAHLSSLPRDYVQKAFSMQADFVWFLRSRFSEARVKAVTKRYALGAMKRPPAGAQWPAVIFWQIDELGRCRTGKIMQYDPLTGHRVKTAESAARIDWVHARLKQKKRLPADFTLAQCFFGQHQLAAKNHPEWEQAPVCIVESEKTAVVATLRFPQTLWLATGGKGNLRKLLATEGHALRGRCLTLYPDKGCLADWQQMAQPYAEAGLDLQFSELLEKTQEPEGSDLADYILAQTPPRHRVG